jgi:hypothetical protein
MVILNTQGEWVALKRPSLRISRSGIEPEAVAALALPVFGCRPGRSA